MKAPALLLVCAVLGFQGLDLPLPPARLGTPPLATTAPPTPPEPDDDGTDPRDTPPPTFYGETIESETDNIVFVIDVSASMNLDGRLDRAKTELARSLAGLASSFTFNVIAYSDTLYVCWPQRRPVTAASRVSATTWLARYLPHGYTATGPAVALALADTDNLTIVLLTDGLPNWGLATQFTPNTPQATQAATLSTLHREHIKAANHQGATISVFGMAARGNMRAFCQAVATDSGGSYYDVP